MKVLEFIVDHTTPNGELIGRVRVERYAGLNQPPRVEIWAATIYARELKTGSWQTYELGDGSIRKLAVIKPSLISHTHLN